MGTIFHTETFLSVLTEHSGATLHRLVGYKGEEVRGLWPLFEFSRGPVQLVFSPPPRLGVPHLGPILCNSQKLKQRKRDRSNRRFVESALDWIDAELGPQFVHVETPPSYRDTRPFQWNEFDVSPRYTYQLDLTGGVDGVMEGFKGQLRRTIRDCEADYEIREGGVDAIRYIIENVRDRFDEQDKSYAIDAEYACDLYRTMPEGQIRAYVGMVDRQRAGGIITIDFGSRCYFWQGGWKPDHSAPINDLIHWHIIQSAIDRQCKTYDLTGANTRRISKYKSKFGPELVTYYELEEGTHAMNLASNIYRKLR